MDYNDYELISLAIENNEDAIKILNDKYYPLILSKSRAFYNTYPFSKSGYSIDDLIQEGLVIFNNAIYNFNELKDANFYTYIYSCLNNNFCNFITKLNNNKSKILDNAIPIDIDVGGDMKLEDVVGEDFFDSVCDDESVSILLNKASCELSDFEECVFSMKIQGFTNGEIADVLDKDYKTIDNALQRIKKKLKF